MKTPPVQSPVALSWHPIAILAVATAGTFVLGLLGAGCSPSPQVTSPSGEVTRFKLVSVNGAAVPATIRHEGVSLQVRSGTFTLGSDGTCGTTTVFSPPSGKELTREVTATYTQSGTSLTMHWRGAGTTTGTLEGSTFTLNNEGMVLVYQR